MHIAFWTIMFFYTTDIFVWDGHLPASGQIFWQSRRIILPYSLKILPNIFVHDIFLGY